MLESFKGLCGQRFDNEKQYSRRNYLRIAGVVGNTDENTAGIVLNFWHGKSHQADVVLADIENLTGHRGLARKKIYWPFLVKHFLHSKRRFEIVSVKSTWLNVVQVKTIFICSIYRPPIYIDSLKWPECQRRKSFRCKSKIQNCITWWFERNFLRL